MSDHAPPGSLPDLGRLGGEGADPAPDAGLFTVPNFLTAVRVACLPWFIWLLARPHGGGLLAAGFLLGSLALTDTLDGRIARRFHQESAIGRVADPLVDRLLVTCAVIGAVLVSAIPWWLAVLVLAREVLMLLGGVALALLGVRQMSVSRAGKLGALGMMCALPWFLLGHAHFRLHSEFHAAAWIAAAGGLALAWAAAAGYVPKARHAVAERRSRRLA